jgi:hypothetical protein
LIFLLRKEKLIFLLRQNLRCVVPSFEIDFLGILTVQAEIVIRQPGNKHEKNPVQRPAHAVHSTANELIRGERSKSGPIERRFPLIADKLDHIGGSIQKAHGHANDHG